MSRNTEMEQLRRRLRRQLLRDLLHGVPPVGATLDEINGYYGYHLQPGTFLVLMIQLLSLIHI